MVPQADSLVLFGGSVFLGAGCAAETWTWSGSSWAQLAVTGPVGRCEAVMASLKDRVLLFGGTRSPGYLADTWIWNGTTWAEETVAGPSMRSEAVMTVW